MVTTATNHEVPEVMPSYFQSIQSTESHPLNSWESLRNFIVSDPVIKRSTDFYVNHQYSVPTIYQRVSRTSIFE